MISELPDLVRGTRVGDVVVAADMVAPALGTAALRPPSPSRARRDAAGRRAVTGDSWEAGINDSFEASMSRVIADRDEAEERAAALEAELKALQAAAAFSKSPSPSASSPSASLAAGRGGVRGVSFAEPTSSERRSPADRAPRDRRR